MPLAQLVEINDRMMDNVAGVARRLHRFHTGKPIGDIAPRVARQHRSDRETVHRVHGDLSDAGGERRRRGVRAKRKAYVEEGIRPALALPTDGKFDELGKLLTGQVAEAVSTPPKSDLDKLVAIQIKEAKAEYEASQRQYQRDAGRARLA